MEEGAKRRLAGAAVMVVLLVIFLPMLFEEDTQSPVSEREMSIPPRPDFERGFDSSVLDGPAEPAVSAFPEYQEPAADDSQMPQELAPPTLFEAPAVPESEIAVEPVAEPEIVIEPESEPEVVAKPPSALVEEKRPLAKPKPASKPAPIPIAPPAKPSVPAQASTNLSSWVIQVASLRDRSRAYALVQDLRAKGFPAYLQEAQVKQKLWHRVRIGPEVERRRIESLAASLKAKTGMSGQIQRYP
jgi:DedD protein